MNPVLPKIRRYYIYLLSSKIKDWIYTVGIAKKGRAG